MTSQVGEVPEGQTSSQIAAKLLEQAIAYGDVEIIGEDEFGRTLFRVAA